jgi:hypothetical protein
MRHADAPDPAYRPWTQGDKVLNAIGNRTCGPGIPHPHLVPLSSRAGHKSGPIPRLDDNGIDDGIADSIDDVGIDVGIADGIRSRAQAFRPRARSGRSLKRVRSTLCCDVR